MDKYVYQGGGYFAGLPARDIDVEEWKQYPKELTKAAINAGLYKLEKQKDEVRNA